MDSQAQGNIKSASSKALKESSVFKRLCHDPRLRQEGPHSIPGVGDSTAASSLSRRNHRGLEEETDLSQVPYELK